MVTRKILCMHGHHTVGEALADELIFAPKLLTHAQNTVVHCPHAGNVPASCAACVPWWHKRTPAGALCTACHAKNASATLLLQLLHMVSGMYIQNAAE
jgi:hypothetical protein